MTTSKRRSSPPRAKGLLEALELSFQDALRTPEGTAEPVALLWADTDRQWADLITRLRAVLPHVFTLGALMATGSSSDLRTHASSQGRWHTRHTDSGSGVRAMTCWTASAYSPAAMWPA